MTDKVIAVLAGFAVAAILFGGMLGITKLLGF
jgi:hypothetical protein